MCGMGRTGTLFAYEQEGIVPDLCVVAKGLGGGYQPIGATLVSKKIFDAVQGGSGFFQHGHTYLGHPMACAAALAVQHTIERERLLDNVCVQGSALLKLAASLGVGQQNIAAVGDWLNDIPMFEAVGRSFAMGQSPEAVREAATDKLVATCDDGGGVAEAIERWMAS